LFIGDFVISFRAGYCGCQKERGIKVDLIVMGKIIGGGFQIGDVGGIERVMDMF
jgi:Glutamate-1-semialdehyde aminotransferase